ncbi:MAG: hypothetical protein V7637_2751, partial [Mycobacteriales bacterium]
MRFSRGVTRHADGVDQPVPPPPGADVPADGFPADRPDGFPADRDAAGSAEAPGAVPSGPVLRAEVWLVLGVSLGASAVFAAINLIGRLTAPIPLKQSTATLNGSYAPTRPLLDLSLQLASITFQVVPALLALHLLYRAGGTLAGIGLDNRRLPRDLAWGAGLAAVIGIPGLLLYLAAHAVGISATVVPEALPPVWWRIPVLVLSAGGNAVIEEIVVVAYLITRL